jgi:L-fuculose-phosphate aldolase
MSGTAGSGTPGTGTPGTGTAGSGTAGTGTPGTGTAGTGTAGTGTPGSEPAGFVSDALRAAVVDCARRMVADGLVIGTSGNVSARAGDLVVITPSGCRYDTLRPEQLCVVSVAGRPLDLPLRPSSELPMHLAAYQQTGAGAVVHTHSMFATAVATTCPGLPAIHYTIGLLGGPIRVAPYATFGTRELADGLRAALADRHGALLQNHGALTVGKDIEQAYERARMLEWLAELYYRSSRLGTPRVLSAAELDAFGAQVSALSYGSNDGPPGPGPSA